MGGGSEGQGVKARLINLIAAVRTLLRSKSGGRGGHWQALMFSGEGWGADFVRFHHHIVPLIVTNIVM
jgi:hypothetical protein